MSVKVKERETDRVAELRESEVPDFQPLEAVDGDEDVLRPQIHVGNTSRVHEFQTLQNTVLYTYYNPEEHSFFAFM